MTYNPVILERLRKSITIAAKVVIVVHKRPDGDALGTALALASLCRKWGSRVKIISPTCYPTFLAWMPGMESVLVYNRKNHDEIVQQIL